MIIITIGRPKLHYAREGFAEYIKRLASFHKVKVEHLSDRISDEKILNSIGDRYCVVLDEHGREYTSRHLADFLNEKSTNGVGEMIFVIGGPDGHSEMIKKRADVLWSMGQMTYPHDLAMVVLAEALYRASTINARHPYHRE